MVQTYTVEIYHQGSVHTLTVPDDTKILDAAHQAGLELPSSCCAGVCGTCASQILEGEVDHGDSMGLGPELTAEGYVLICSAYPRSDLKIETDKEEMVYERQFGRV